MLFAESHALLGLVVHAILGAALVGASTRLVIRMRARAPRGRFSHEREVRRLAAVSVALFAAAFLSGTILYPTYKIRVRGEYLDEGTVVVQDYRDRMHARDLFRQRTAPRVEALPERGATPESEPADRNAHDLPAAGSARDVPTETHLPLESAKLARWFDVKEHWVALGLALSAACALLLFGWRPTANARVVASTAFALALCAAATSWLGAIIGILATATRSVAPLG